MDIHEWLRIDGSTPRERIQNGYRQFIVVGILVWAGVFVVWEFLSLVVGPAAAAVVVVVLGVYVALDLRDRMIGPIEDEASGEPPEDESEGPSEEDGADQPDSDQPEEQQTEQP